MQSLSSLIDANFLLVNKIVILAITLVFFGSVAILRRSRNEDVPSPVAFPLRLSFIGLILIYAATHLDGMPAYRSVFENLQGIIVLLCLAKLLNYLIIDIYLPFRTGRPTPSFLRDTIRLVVYLAIAVISLRVVFSIDLTAIVTTTTVLTAVLAFAMQNTLTSALSGFAVQREPHFNPGNWIIIKEKNISGEILNVGFRFTTLKCSDNTVLMVPNGTIIQSAVTVQKDRSIDDTGVIFTEIMLGYDVPPEKVRAILMDILKSEPDIVPEPEPAVRMLSMADSGIIYQLRYAVDSPMLKAPVQDRVLTMAWYAVNRAGFSFPFPHRQILTEPTPPPFIFKPETVKAELATIELFSPLDDHELDILASGAAASVYGPGELVVKQGDEGDSLFVVLKGKLRVTVDGQEVASLGPDAFFGEMSLLTGEPRRASVSAVDEVWLVEVRRSALEGILRDNPEIVMQLGSILARRSELNREAAQSGSEDVETLSRRDEYLKRLKNLFRL